MPSVYPLKPAFQRLLRPWVGWLVAHGVTANQVTVTSALLSLLGGAAIALWPAARWPLLLLPVVLLLRMALNAVDGMLAREHRMDSPLGAQLNELGDVISDIALYLPLALVPGINPLLIALFVPLALLTEFAGVQALQIGASRRYEGPLGKSDRALLLGAIALLLGVGVPAGLWVDGVLAIACVLALSTTVNRSRAALREIGG